MATTSKPKLTTVLGAVTVIDRPPLGGGAAPELNVPMLPSAAVELAKNVVTVLPVADGAVELEHVTLARARLDARPRLEERKNFRENEIRLIQMNRREYGKRVREATMRPDPFSGRSVATESV